MSDELYCGNSMVLVSIIFACLTKNAQYIFCGYKFQLSCSTKTQRIQAFLSSYVASDHMLIFVPILRFLISGTEEWYVVRSVAHSNSY